MRLAGRLLLVAYFVPGLLAAQQPAGRSVLDSGTVVRFRIPSGAQIAGRLVAPIEPDSPRLRFCPYPGRQCTADAGLIAERSMAEVSQLEVRSGTRVLSGLAIGATVGVGFGFLAIDLGENLGETPYSTSAKVGTLVGSTIAWGIIGALVGWGTDTWKPWP